MPAPPAPPTVSLEPGERLEGQWAIPWRKAGIESVTRLVLTNRRLVVHCIFTSVGWFPSRHQREAVDLGNWLELLDAHLERVPEAFLGQQQAGFARLTDLIIDGRSMLFVDGANYSTVQQMLPTISRVREARIAELAARDRAPPPPP